MKEMLGGCCVCSDERGWTENPLVYCDGQGCTVAVHQACYGIVTVPTGPWYCRKCESQERSARVRCELCPSRDGALKRTDQAGWAHVVCALYIPEVRFGNVTTMEPIILQLIPSERFNKKKGGNVKTIPPYKPIPADNGSSDSSPEKDSEALIRLSSNNVKRKSASSKSGAFTQKSKASSNPSIHINGVTDDKSSSDANILKDNTNNSSKFTTSNFVETIVTQSESVFGHEIVSTTSALTIPVTAITTSASTSYLVHKNGNQSKSATSSSNKPLGNASRKRKTGARTPNALGNENSNQSVNTQANGSLIVTTSIVDQQINNNSIQSTIAEVTSLSTMSDTEKSKKLKSDDSPIQSIPSAPLLLDEATTIPISMSITQLQTSVLTQSFSTMSNSIVVSVPLTATSLPNFEESTVRSSPTLYQQLQQSLVTAAVSLETRTSVIPNVDQYAEEEVLSKLSRSQSSDKQEKLRKPKRGSSSSQSIPTSSQLITSAATSLSNSAVVTTTKRTGRNNRQTPPPSVAVASIQSIIQGPTLGTGHFSSVGTGSGGIMGPTVKDSPPSSPGSESMSSTGPGRRKRKGAGTASNTPTPSASSTPTLANHTKEEKEVKLFQNGVSAPHMLGNQLNPTSTMAQKMSDTLSQELEAHSIFTEASNSTTNLVGPQLHSRVIATIRSSQTAPTPTSFSSVFSNTNANASATSAGALASGAMPQTLDQLLERQWEQGSQFLMEQAQHFDIASLLSCLHQLRAENLRLEEHVNSLLQRRDHLLAVNARLAIPLTNHSNTHPVNSIHPSMNPSHPNLTHPEVPPVTGSSMPRANRETRMNNAYLPHSSSSSHATSLENGLPPETSPPTGTSQYQHRGSLVAPQPSPALRHSPAGSGYHQGQTNTIVLPANANNPGVVRNSSVTPDPLRGTQR
ncbi:protein AF-10-like isoform X2 [Belonocnema kinseyi]|uniref:protein AF-10-like isoform X2 n=1 Tax=Belonocnema kinseyi TaxID=2817044 RepID=UPI00143DED90|nr:protein AF-10-like isoform X2 [Belonocnema kinseyi]